MRGRVATVSAVALGLTLAWAAMALAAPAGPYKGTTTEHGSVTFTVTAHAVVNFTVQDGYNDGCHFSGGVGGIPSYRVSIKSMALSSSGRFAGRVTESNAPFAGSAVVAVTGRFLGSQAFGTVTVVGKTCGTDSPTPSASMFYESFSATHR
ncbi:MAG: hypothetical protein ACHQFZ_05290 [Acidimicrobiales bacterium]